MATSVSKGKSRALRVGVDTGGTFTDFVYEWNGESRVFKVPSTPDDPCRAIADGLKRISEETTARLVDFEVIHGTTVGTNALLQRRGARTALVTSAGFEDVIEIGRQARPELYNLNATKPPPLVESSLRFGVRERVTASGDVIEELTKANVTDLVKKLGESKCESIAISLIFSFVFPKHEKQIEQALAALGVPLSISHQILPEYREYERTSTVVVNAYLQPLMGRYLNRLVAATAPRPSKKNHSPTKIKTRRPHSLRVMQSSGGSISAEAAANEPVRTILSGPAGGVVGALRTAGVAHLENIIAFDMGGTSTDVSLCDRAGIRLTNEAIVAGLPIAVSMMDIHTVGAGGGSIARIDEGGSLRVGPESAGSEPGPACYGRSNLPTVTDAHVVLGHFPGAALLGGEFRLDADRAHDALNELAGQMRAAARRKVTRVEAAHGIVDVVTANMERALRHISVERGHDPRNFTLIPFGGAGGLHAADLARSLRIPRVLVPAAPGALSAIGVVTADIVKDQTRTIMLKVGPDTGGRLEKIFRLMEREGQKVLQSEGFIASRQKHERSLAVRYVGQSFEIEIKHVRGDVGRAFHRAHKTRYGYAQPHNPVEIVSARLRSIGTVPTPRSRRSRYSSSRVATPKDFVEAYFDGRKVSAAVYQREKLTAGSRLRAPCIVTEYSGTTLVPKDATAEVDGLGNILIAA